jgi:uncharacterized protein (DUF2235 family)
MPKAIVVFSDGTGNSSAALFKTNVWRMYDALDQSQPGEGERRQIAYYDNGVGTSTFKPLAMLGGVFGFGLKRNLLSLYKFVCRNYEDRDEIYAFGFSRGGFTIRLLVGLIATQGLINSRKQVVLDRHAIEAYREYRRRFNQTGGLVTFFRNLRDLIVKMIRRLGGVPSYDKTKNAQPSIRFIGVWDTVAAYGMPISELTRGIDKWVWPLSMPNYRLSNKVATARHALALDDERDTFHPLLWDEVWEEQLIADKSSGVQSGRLQQVWFAGMHSDVGGGYPDDSLAYVSLEWMLDEARKAGLRFKPHASEQIHTIANPYGPMHNSRSGLGGYYRYQPRKITARLKDPDKSTTIMQNPDLEGHGLLTSVQVHESVVRRIVQGTDGYAPIVLPDEFKVVTANGLKAPPGHHDNQAARAIKQEAVWNDVWRRRVNYFSAVAVSLAIVLMPWFPDAAACAGPQCLLSPVINAVGAILPGFLDRWVDAFSRSPGVFLGLVVLLGLLLSNASRLQTLIKDQMAGLWQRSFSDERMSDDLCRDREDLGKGLIYKLRTGSLYQMVLAYLKWRLVPSAFGVTLLLFLVALAVLVSATVYIRADIAIAERTGSDCASGKFDQVGDEARRVTGFRTETPCWPTGVAVTKGENYRVSLVMTDQWIDNTIVTDPTGFGADKMGVFGSLFAPLRRSVADPWFRPMLKIVAKSGMNHTHALDMLSASSAHANLFFAEFKARQTGEAVFFVNDAVDRWPFARNEFYRNNLGTADLCIERVFREAAPPRPAQCLAKWVTK